MQTNRASLSAVDSTWGSKPRVTRFAFTKRTDQRPENASPGTLKNLLAKVTLHLKEENELDPLSSFAKVSYSPSNLIDIMVSSQFAPVSLEDFDKVLGTTSTEVSSVALGGKILSCSDEWFAPASDLLKVSLYDYVLRR
jgi:hypothetical protein